MSGYIKFIFSLWIVLSGINLYGEKASGDFGQLQKNSAFGFVVPYVLRYDPNTWLRKYTDGRVELRHLGSRITVTIYEEKGASSFAKSDEELQKSLSKRCSDISFYSGFEIAPSEITTINGIDFLHQRVILHLAPHSKHPRRYGKSEYYRLGGETGSKEQTEYYICNHDKGQIIICIDAQQLITPEEQVEITELCNGFSFDGGAGRGPKALRALKNVFEAVTSQ